jgi:hypothetical protein
MVLPKTCKIESDGTDVFVVFNGVKIAKRGCPGTPRSKTWIPLEPGYTVLDCSDGAIEVVFNKERTRVQTASLVFQLALLCSFLCARTDASGGLALF